MHANLSARRARIGLELDSQPESVALVRSALAALGEAADLDEALVMNLKTAVSEACNNVVVHAYGDRHGRMLVTIELRPETLDVNVRDHGGGIHRLAAGDNRMGLGFGLMAALATRTEFSSPPDGGTEVRMSFDRYPAADGSHSLALPDPDELAEVPASTLSGDLVVHLSTPTLVGPVLGRLVRATAANAGFSVARFDDLYPVADALAEHASRAADGAVSFAIESSRRSMRLTAGPFNMLPVEVDPLGDLVDQLTREGDEHGHELLHLTLLEQPAVGR